MGHYGRIKYPCLAADVQPMRISISIFTMLLLSFYLFFAICAGHSWVEELRDLEQGVFVGDPGYTRNDGIQL
jgi:hypothetical protein